MGLIGLHRSHVLFDKLLQKRMGSGEVESGKIFFPVLSLTQNSKPGVDLFEKPYKS